MKTSRIITLLVATLFIANTAVARGWDKVTLKTYKKERTLGLQIDMSKASIMGIDSAEFITYYAGTEGMSEKSVDLMLKRFKNLTADAIKKDCEKTIIYPAVDGKARFTMLLEISGITDHAGIIGTLYIFEKGASAPQNLDNARIYNVNLEDGRWNTFEKLLYEAAEDLGKAIAEIASNVKDDNKIVKLQK